MVIVFGTTNRAKVKQLQSALANTRIKVMGISSSTKKIKIKEDGKTPLENARKKAIIYSQHLKKAVFSMDNALYLNGLPEHQQPGLNVRRIVDTGKLLKDEQMVKYYSKLISKLGDRVDGYWEFGICLANPDGISKEDIFKSPRIFTAKPSNKIQKGYPLESLQIDPVSGKYLSEMSKSEQDQFWQQHIGSQLREFFEIDNQVQTRL